ncbi:chaplin [Streptomyces polygonati]|uniref:Chaplin n=1 Tax=Streptomyces polygonati TaxID=1617087 RepID=A0ABV8HPL6_9ACTN
MRQILSRSLLTVAAAGSVLAAAGGYASADAGAEGAASGSPGVLSGNNVQVPVHVPVNACGNTVDVVGVANPAFGNHCANESHSAGSGTGSGVAGAGAAGVAKGSPGVLSGNSVAVPVQAPVNACGNTVDAVGVLNPAMGNSCANDDRTSSVATPRTPVAPPPPRHATPPPHTGTPRIPAQAGPRTPRMADTGVGGRELGTAGAASAALLLGGAMLYRRSRRPAYVGRTR